MRWATMVAAMLAALMIHLVPASAATRVALVIGNSAYQNVPFLPNPVNDATDLSASLQRLDFTVKTLTNARYDDMRRALIEFGQQARGAEIALIFFAGHGIQIGGDNWLIPVDAELATDLNVANETIGLQQLTRAVSNTSKLGLVILDACRSNPFVPKMQSTNLSRAVDRGFVRVEPSDNILVAYAARDGTTASDGSGRNSPFTRSLLKNIETPDLEISFLFRNVRDDVMAATKREQQPFVYGSLSREMVYLKAGTPGAKPAVQEATNPAPPAEKAATGSEKVAAFIAQNAATIYRSPRGVTLGNQDGDVTFVEFFDYNCQYCKRSVADLLALIQSDPKLKVVLKEFPVLSPGSVEAAQVALAARLQDPSGRKYFDLHQRLFAGRGPANKAYAMAAAKAAGFDTARIEKDLSNPEVKAALEENLKLGEAMEMNGTPSYLIGKQVVVGAIGLAGFKEKIAMARCGKTDCNDASASRGDRN